ncbi:MAG: sensor histidine kinase [Candidatus Hodarchaeales archaeon]|jgi:signal transduction histidine kinase
MTNDKIRKNSSHFTQEDISLLQNKLENEMKIIQELILNESKNMSLETEKSILLSLVNNTKSLLNLCKFQQIQNSDLQEKLTENEKALESFLYTVSHDLKQPLITIYGYAGILKEEISSYSDMDEWLDGILVASSKMDHMVNVLLELSRIGRKSNSDKIIDLEDLMEQILLTQLSFSDNSEISYEIQSPLPKLFSKKQLIEQVFTQIISNSIKFMGKNNNSPTIVISAEKNQKGLTIRIDDNGIGIDPKHHEKIFNLFFSVKKIDKVSTSTGSGLTIVKKILDYLGGKIWLNSEKGKGATFYVQFPKKLESNNDGAI